MSFGSGFSNFGVDSGEVGPVESSTSGWQSTQRLNLYQAARLGLKEARGSGQSGWGEFKEGFKIGAGFSMAVMGAGFNAVRNVASGHVKGNFG